MSVRHAPWTYRHRTGHGTGQGTSVVTEQVTEGIRIPVTLDVRLVTSAEAFSCGAGGTRRSKPPWTTGPRLTAPQNGGKNVFSAVLSTDDMN